MIQLVRNAWRWLRCPSPYAVDRRAIQLIAQADRFARLQERRRILDEIRGLLDYYEQQIDALGQANERLRHELQVQDADVRLDATAAQTTVAHDY